MTRTSFAPGKIILSGEYAVLFGFPGIAVPVSHGIKATFKEDASCKGVEIEDAANTAVRAYIEKIVAVCGKNQPNLCGQLSIRSTIPFGKGLGSSTALVVAITRALIGEDARETAVAIEDALNPGNSGLDFNVIWENAPILFRKGTAPKHSDLPSVQLQNSTLSDTGLPSESTAQLVAWVRSREKELREPLSIIGNCTERLVQGEQLESVMRDHHRAQVALGVVPSEVQKLIVEIERGGGSAKVIGAGARTGSAGMVLAVGNQKEIRNVVDKRSIPIMTL